MMKLYLFLPFILIGLSVSAQDNDNLPNRNPNANALKISIGPASISSAPGISIQSEYAWSSGRFFELLANVSMYHAYDGITNEERVYQDPQSANTYTKSVHYSMMSIGSTICLTPVKNYRHRLLLGVGLNGCHLVETSSVVNGLAAQPTFVQKNDRSTGAAFGGVIAYEYNVNERFMFGVRGNGIYFKTFIPALMTTLGYRF